MQFMFKPRTLIRETYLSADDTVSLFYAPPASWRIDLVDLVIVWGKNAWNICVGARHSVEANVLDCDIVVSMLEIKACNWFRFWAKTLGKGMKRNPSGP